MPVALPLLVPWVAGVLLLALDGRRRWVGWLAVAAIAANLALLAVLSIDVLSHGRERVVTGDWPAGVGIVLRADALGCVFAVVSSIVLLAAMLHEVLDGVRSRLLPALVVLMTTGLTGLFVTGDVFSFYVFFEISMTSAYVMTAYGREARQVGAALIFAVVNLLGSFLFLIGVAATYHVTGTLEMATVAERMLAVEPNAAILIAVTFFIAFGVKLGLFPFHFWLPTVYAGTRPAVAAILSGALANIGAYGLLRFGAGLLSQELALGADVLIGIGALSILYGAVLAISRRDGTEMLAYSAIGQVGYVLVALGVGGPVGLAAAVLYAVVNSLNKALLFLAAHLRGPLVAAAFLVGALSVAGVPPAAGFLAKLEVLRTGIDAGSVLLVVLFVVGGALSFAYLFPVFQRRFWRDADRHAPSPLAVRLVTVALAALVLGLGLWPEPLVALSADAADALRREMP